MGIDPNTTKLVPYINVQTLIVLDKQWEERTAQATQLAQLALKSSSQTLQQNNTQIDKNTKKNEKLVKKTVQVAQGHQKNLEDELAAQLLQNQRLKDQGEKNKQTINTFK